MSAYYKESRRYYADPPTIHQSRGSSSDSNSSHDSKRSTESYHTPSRSTMGYSGGSQSTTGKPVVYKYRAPDAGMALLTHAHRVITNEYRPSDNKYVESIRRGNVEVINQKRRGYDPIEPRASEATSADYSSQRDETRHSSKHSSHKHSSRR